MAEENFTNNPFYLALSKHFKDLYAKACERHCVICIPTISSLPVTLTSPTKRGINPLSWKRSELGLHILYPSCLQVVEKGLFDCVTSGYSVKIDWNGGTISGFSGFSRAFTANILSEEKCYDDNGKSFTLLTVSRPLGEGMDIHHVKGPELDYSLSHLSVASCEEYLRSVIHPRDPNPILAKFKKSVEQLYLTYHLLPDYLDDLAAKIQRLTGTSAEEILKSSTNANAKDVKAALDLFAHTLLHKKILRFLTEEVCKESDMRLLKSYGNVKRVEHIGDLSLSHATFPLTDEILGKVSSFESPLQQMLAITEIIRCLQKDITSFHQNQLRTFKTNVDSVTLTADDTLSLLLESFGRARPPNLYSVLTYVKVFHGTPSDGSQQYALTVFEAAVRFLGNPKSDTAWMDGDRKRSAESFSSADDDWIITGREVGDSSSNGSSLKTSPRKDLAKEVSGLDSVLAGVNLGEVNKTSGWSKPASPLDSLFGSFGRQK